MRYALLLAALLAVACSDPGTGTEGDGGAGDAGELDPRCPYASTPGVWRAVVSGPGPTDCVYACRAPDGGSLRFCQSGTTAVCADTRTDPNNCGTCGTRCSAGQVCGTPTPTQPACRAP